MQNMVRVVVASRSQAELRKWWDQIREGIRCSSKLKPRLRAELAELSKEWSILESCCLRPIMRNWQVRVHRHVGVQVYPTVTDRRNWILRDSVDQWLVWIHQRNNVWRHQYSELYGLACTRPTILHFLNWSKIWATICNSHIPHQVLYKLITRI